MAERTGPRRAARVVVGVVALVAVSATAAGLTYTGVFGARRLIVRGEHHRSEGEILSTAGLVPGVNVFHLDRAAPREALLADPWIAEARIETSLPSTVTVRVVERRPVAVAGADALAADGTVLPGAAIEDLPTIVGASDARTPAAAVVAALHPPERRALDEVVVGTEGEITLSLGALTVRWGSGGEDARKAAALAALLRSAGYEAFATIDVSSPGAPAAVPARVA